MRDPYAKALRVKPQQVIPDKREKTLRELYDQALREETPADIQRLLDQLK
jgi:hypothetical protein